MATNHNTISSILFNALPKLHAWKVSPTLHYGVILYSRPLILHDQFKELLTTKFSFAIFPNLIETLWGSILRAVPKKKTSHSKKRSRQRAGKALKDVTALNNCPGCGHIKRIHVLCPYCVKGGFVCASIILRTHLFLSTKPSFFYFNVHLKLSLSSIRLSGS